jgi:outer membrane immunogenic protein
MKKLVLSTAGLLALCISSAFAADLPMKAPPAPLPVWTWTGFYVGVNGGAGWGTTETTLTSISAPGLGAVAANFPVAQNSRSGFLGGGQIGYNYQSGWAVFGVQADIDGLDVKGTTPCIVVLSCTSKSDWLATVSGRIGGVIADKTLVYVKGGAAWLNTTQSLNVPSLGGIGGIGGLGGVAGLGSASAESTALGGLLGMGVEYAFSPNWSAFIEYDYVEFQKTNVSLPLTALAGAGTAVNANLSVLNKLSIAKVGVNYKF